MKFVYKNLLMITFFMLFMQTVFAQEENFFYNIVKTGIDNNADYGLIIGKDSSKCYFVVVRNVDERFPKTLPIYIDKVKKSLTLSQHLYEFKVKDFRVALYEMDARAVQFQNKFYSTNINTNQAYSVFLDATIRKEELNVYKSQENHIFSMYYQEDGIGIMQTRGSALRGMPIFNYNGNLVGISAENKSNTYPSYHFIAMHTIYASILAYENERGFKCRYFTLLLPSQERTPCAQQEYEKMVTKQQDIDKRQTYLDSLKKEEIAVEKLQNQRKEEYRDAMKEYNNNRKLAWSWGLSGSYQMNLSSLVTNPGDVKFIYTPTEKIMGGINFFLNPDSKTHLTFQPKVGVFTVGIPPNYEAPNNFTFHSLRYLIGECPILLELLFDKENTITSYIAFGYVPGVQKEYTLKYSDMNAKFTILTDRSMKFNHSGSFHYGWSFAKLRIGVYVQQQFSSFHERKLEINNNKSIQKPFISYNRLPTSFGIDLVVRMRSSWGEKNRSKESKPRASQYL